MGDQSSCRIVFIGAGNVAYNLANELYSKGINIIQVYSRTIDAAKELAQQIGADHTNAISNISRDADIYFCCLPDNILQSFLEQWKPSNGLIVHTAGSLSIDILTPFVTSYGVFYPLQTFSKIKRTNFENIPICIETNTTENGNILKSIANRISSQVFEITSDQRKTLHVAAVFSCNFVNHMYAISEILLKEKNIPFEILYPLIKETTDKTMQYSPSSVQTGPAIRNDENILKEHINSLNDQPEFQSIYAKISQSIQNINKQYD